MLIFSNIIVRSSKIFGPSWLLLVILTISTTTLFENAFCILPCLKGGYETVSVIEEGHSLYKCNPKLSMDGCIISGRDDELDIYASYATMYNNSKYLENDDPVWPYLDAASDNLVDLCGNLNDFAAEGKNKIFNRIFVNALEIKEDERPEMCNSYNLFEDDRINELHFSNDFEWRRCRELGSREISLPKCVLSDELDTHYRPAYCETMEKSQIFQAQGNDCWELRDFYHIFGHIDERRKLENLEACVDGKDFIYESAWESDEDFPEDYDHEDHSQGEDEQNNGGETGRKESIDEYTN